MKNKLLIIGIYSLVLMLLAIFVGSKDLENQKLIYIFMFPFEIISLVLRQLIQSGTLGIVIAQIFYLLIGLLPIGLLLILYFRKKSELLSYIFYPIFSVCLFFLLWIFIYQSFVFEHFMHPNWFMMHTVENKLLEQYYFIFKFGSVFILYGIIFLYVFLKYIQSETLEIQKIVSIILYSIIALSLFAGIYTNLSSLIQFLSADQLSNDYETLQHVLVFLTTGVTHVLIVCIVLKSELVFQYLIQKQFNHQLVFQTKSIFALARILILLIVTGQVLINIFVLAFASKMNNIQFYFDVPWSYLILAIGFLVLSNYLVKANELYEENELTI